MDDPRRKGFAACEACGSERGASLGIRVVPSPVLIETFRICLIAFGAVAAYGGHQLLDLRDGAPGERAAVSRGLGTVSMASAAASALLAIGLPAILSA